jgi:hypothetical protein
MPHLVLVDPRFTFDGHDLADHVRELTLTVSTDQVEDVAGGDTVTTFMAGLRKFGGTISGLQDYAANEVDSYVMTAWLARSAVAITIGADKTNARSTSNPEYDFTAFVAEYNPLAARMGEACPFSLTVAPTTDLTRNVTP